MSIIQVACSTCCLSAAWSICKKNFETSTFARLRDCVNIEVQFRMVKAALTLLFVTQKYAKIFYGN